MDQGCQRVSQNANNYKGDRGGYKLLTRFWSRPEIHVFVIIILIENTHASERARARAHARTHARTHARAHTHTQGRERVCVFF